MNEKPLKSLKSGERKAPKKISKKYLENAALHYLQRYATSAENLKRVLLRKVKKSCAFHQVPAEDFAPMVDELVARYGAVGLVDDAVFARARVTSLRRQGRSKQEIMARLQVKGLKKAEIENALRLVDEEQEDPELAAAIADAVKDHDPSLVLFGLSGSPYIDIAEQRGLRVASEVFADRTYQDDGGLTPRTHPKALITDPNASIAQVLQMVRDNTVSTLDGRTIPIRAETICIHGDGAHAVEFAAAIDRVLAENDIRIGAITRD